MKNLLIRALVSMSLMATGVLLIPAASAQEAPLAPAVTVARVALEDVVAQVPVSGSVVARDEVLVYPRVSGFTIDHLYFDEGESVLAGDILAQLNTRTLDAQLAQAVAELARAQASIRQAQSQISAAAAALTQAQAALRRAQQLFDSGTGTQATLDQAIANEQTASANLASANDGEAVAEAQLKQAEAQRDIAALNLEYATIVSPVDGLISSRNGQRGAIATSAGTPIFRIIAGGLVEVEAEVVETALGQIRRNDAAVLEIAGIGQVSGIVRRISPVVDPVSRLGTIRLSTDPDPGLRTGLFANGWVITDRHQALTVPATAVLTDASGSYVLRVEGTTIRHTPVDAGLVWKDLREITNGLHADDTVVVRAGAFFADGDMIRPVDSDGEATSGAGQ